jgi:hypothetical protein
MLDPESDHFNFIYALGNLHALFTEGILSNETILHLHEDEINISHTEGKVTVILLAKHELTLTGKVEGMEEIIFDRLQELEETHGGLMMDELTSYLMEHGFEPMFAAIAEVTDENAMTSWELKRTATTNTGQKFTTLAQIIFD